MNRRIINKILTGKHEKFLASIQDETVRELVAKNTIITGGSIASLLIGERVKDYDYYFADKETVEAVARYYVGRFCAAHPEIVIKPEVKIFGERVKIVVQSAGIVSENGDQGYQYFEQHPDEAGMAYVEKTVADADDTDAAPMERLDEGEKKESYRPVFMSANAITLSDSVQLVIRFYGDAAEIHRNYDFIHCCNYWTPTGGVVLNPAALESLMARELQYQGSLYPVCSVIRARKFLRRGWYINAGQYLKMCFQISQLDLTDINVLEEQLTGVDAAYFYQVIQYCKKHQAEDAEFKITAPYLVSIIDKIFG